MQKSDNRGLAGIKKSEAGGFLREAIIVNVSRRTSMLFGRIGKNPLFCSVKIELR